MEKVKITRTAAGKSGTTNGKTWSKIGIQIESKPDIWINGFTSAQTENWKEGTETSIDLEEDPKWGWQFKLPKTGEALVELTRRVECLEETVNALVRAVKPDMGQATTGKEIMSKIEGEPPLGDGVQEYEPPSPSDSDLPF